MENYYEKIELLVKSGEFKIDGGDVIYDDFASTIKITHENSKFTISGNYMIVEDNNKSGKIYKLGEIDSYRLTEKKEVWE
jgi:hypothetical protein